MDALEEGGLPTTSERLAPLIGEKFERLNHAPRPLPGVRELVAAIEARRIRWAIATSSRMAQVSTSVAALELDTELTIVDGSQIEHAEPEPDHDHQLEPRDVHIRTAPPADAGRHENRRPRRRPACRDE